MTSIFLFSLIVGGGLLALSLLGDLFGAGDADMDVDLDTDLDLDLDTDLAVDADPDVDTDVAGAFKVFTIRNLTYFLFGFGAVGWILTATSPELPLLLVTAAATGSGALAAALAMAAFGWLKATDAGFMAEESSFVGCEGRVVLPLRPGKVGQIVVRRQDREHELRALPFDGSAPSPEEWRSVLVIEMDGGTARVSPLEALTPADSPPADH